MKFICEKCKTKYSIADKKVKGKVLKIRCKNCSNIITVREARKKKGVAAGRVKKGSKAASPGGGDALSRALDGALRESGPPPGVNGGANLKLAPVADLAQSRQERKEAASEFLDVKTQFSAPPDFAALTADSSESSSAEDEWYLAVEGNQFGPMEFSELCSRVKRGEAAIEAFVWRDGYEDWRDLETVKEIQPFIPKHPPPPPKGKSGLLNIGTPAAGSEAVAMVPAPETLAPDGPIPQGPPSAAEAPPATEATHKEVSALAAETLAAHDPTPSVDLDMEPTPFGEPLPAADEKLAVGEDKEEESGVAPLPMAAPEEREESKPAAVAFGSAIAPTPTPAVLAAPPTPFVMKLAAAGGIIAAITGLVMVIYFIFIDGPKSGNTVASTQAVARQEPVKPPSRVAAVSQEESDEVVIEFPAESIERSETKERIVKKGPSPKVAAVVKPKEPVLTEEQKRLKRLYGGGGTAKGPSELPSALPSAKKKKRGPTRRISASEIGNLQRRYKKALKACYERALKRDNSLVEVKAEIEVTVGDSGIVRKASVSNVDSMELKVCLSRVVKRWNFPAVGEQTIAFPIIFRGS